VFVNPAQFQGGFAFGIGIERQALVKLSSADLLIMLP
jgi:phenylalanyl-tRNA synthetase alpha subunit